MPQHRRQAALRALLALVVVNVIAFAFMAPAAAEDAEARIEALEQQVRELARELEEVQAGEAPPSDERMAALEEKLAVVATELEALRTAQTVPEDKPLASRYGFGPAASKVYNRDKGLSIGGYGEVRLRSKIEDDAGDVFDALRGVLYVGYKFSDRIVFNSEYEFEHAGTGGGGSASIEFMTLDFFMTEAVNVRGGLVLLPMGFINEMHEPTTFFGASRPEVERQIIPTTWRENGGGIFGDIGRFSYRVYGVNGFDATGFSSSGLRGGRQKGSEAQSSHWAFVARADYEVLDGLLLGASVYGGNSGQNQVISGVPIPDAFTTIYEVHGEYKYAGVSLRGLYTQAFVNQAGQLTDALFLIDPMDATVVASRMEGGYGEIAYDVLPLILPDTKMSFEPFFRYERLDTQNQVPAGYTPDLSKRQNIYTVGASYKPHPQVVVKLDYRYFDLDAGSKSDEVEFGLGFVF